LAEEHDRRTLFFYLQNRFGIPEYLFAPYLLFEGKGRWWLLRESAHLMEASRLKVSMVGLRAFNKVGGYVKPSTRMIQIFGRFATRGILEIDRQQLNRLLAREALPADLEIENGYIILSLKSQPLGLGLLIDGVVISQIPRKELNFLIS
jgi:NOL1/NOP2/fmu family ribosome biogenesis protein